MLATWHRLLVVALVALVALGTSAGAPAQVTEGQSPRILRVDVKHVDENNLPLSSSQGPDTIAIVLALVPGELFGAPAGRPIAVQQLSDSRQFELDLNLLGERVEGETAPLTDNAARSGLVIAPEATRIARVATFAANPVTRRTIGYTGFTDSVSREPLLLVYFDRPCRVSGVVRWMGEEYFHDVTIAHRGFHWLRISETSRGRFSIQNTPGTENIFLAIRASLR